jgi:uncharacterized RDD family membrane protein YckC
VALYTAPFVKRIAAVALDGVAVAVLVAATVHGANAVAWQWSARVLDPFWETPEVVQTLVEPAGEPSTVKQDGIERTTQFSRETRIYADGAVRIFSVVEGTARFPDGTVTSGRAENQIGESRQAYWRRRVTYAVVGVIAFLYYGLFESSSRQATPGKQLLGLRVTDLKGRRLTPLRAWLRQVTKLATVAMSGMGYLPALFTMKAQTVHDILAGTLVVTGRSAAVSS